MELILLRHGIAEDFAASDAERALTPEGAEKIARVSLGIKSMLQKDAAISIWSSPLLRTMQTAKIASKTLRVKKIEKIGELAVGEDMFPLLSGWAAVKTSDVLILVGHQPYLTELAVRLAGVPLPFKKGAAAGYGVRGEPPFQAALRWFVQPGAWPAPSE